MVLVYELPHPGIAGEIIVDVTFCLCIRYADVLGQAERRYAVDNAEVDRLGLAPHFGRDLFRGEPEDLRGGPGVDVFIALKGLDQRGISAHMGEDAQFDLGVIGRKQARPAFGDERLSDLPPDLGAYGDVLEVRLTARKPAGRGHGLVERGVKPAGFRIDHQRKRVDIGRLEFCERSVFQDLSRQRMDRRQFFKHVHIGREPGLGLFGRREPQFYEQDIRELLREN